MSTDKLERLLITLAVRLHAFALCEIKDGWRLTFDPMEAVTIHYILRGKGTICIENGAHVSFDQHSMIVVPAKVSQSLGAPDAKASQGANEDNCSLVGGGLVKFTAGDGSRDILFVCGTIAATYAGALGLFDALTEPIVESVAPNSVLRSAFDAMLAEVAAPGVGSQAMIEALMKQCLVLLLRQHLTRLSIDSPFFAALQDRRLARAVAAIVERPADPHTVESLAEIAGMSRSTFSDRFSALFGLAPIAFVQKVRLRLGAHLLASTALPVEVIAVSVGYSSRSYFTRAFRTAYGADPTTYRAFGGAEEQEPQPIEAKADQQPIVEDPK